MNSEPMNYVIEITFRDKIYDRLHQTRFHVRAPNEGGARSCARAMWLLDHAQEEWIFQSSRCWRAGVEDFII